MDPIMFTAIVLLRSVVVPALAIVAGGYLLAKTPVGRRIIEAATNRAADREDLLEMRDQLEHLQYQLDETQERLDVAERMLASPRFRQIARGQDAEPLTPV